MNDVSKAMLYNVSHDVAARYGSFEPAISDTTYIIGYPIDLQATTSCQRFIVHEIGILDMLSDLYPLSKEAE